MSSKVQCNILLASNRTLFNIDQGWEGIPYNIIWNGIISVVIIILIVAIRWRNYLTQDDPKKNDDFLHFIFSDRKSNDMQIAKYRLINRNHRLAYLPQILHEYDHLLSEKLDKKSDENVEYFKHSDMGDLIANQKSFEEFPTLRSDSNLLGKPESKLNKMYSGLGVRKYDSKEEDEQLTRLKSILIENYRSKELTKRESDKRKRRSFFSLDYINEYLFIKDEEILKNKGGDALQYLLFQRYLICFLAFLTLLCLLVILPINLMGDSEPEMKQFARTTITNLGKDSNLMWVHSLVTIIVVILGVYMMSHFSALIKATIQSVDKRILLIENIPETKRQTRHLLKFFNQKFPKSVIKRITFVYDIRQLTGMKNQLLTAIEAKKYCYQYRLIYGQRCEVRPYCCGRCGGFCCCCGCCPKLDGVLYYAEEKAELEQEIEKEVKELVVKPRGLVFIEFESKEMAKQIYKHFHSRRFICNSWLHRITTICGMNSDPMLSYRWRIQYAPYPEDIEWNDLSWESRYEKLWSLLMHIIMFIIFLFLTTPSIAVDTILLPLTEKAIKNDTTGATDTSFSREFTQFSKPYLLMLMTSILPSLIMVVQYQIPYKTKSAMEHGLMFKSFLFLVLMVLVLPPLRIYTAAVLVDTVLSENSTQSSEVNWNCLFFTQNSGFFINYILSSATVANVFETSRISELLSYFIYLFYISRSLAEYESARQKIRFLFSFGIRYSRILLMFAIVVTYSISSPLVSVAGLLYMVIKHLVDRYNLLYAYYPTPISYRIHSTAVIFVQLTLVFLLIQVSTTLSQYEDKDAFLTPSAPLFILLMFFLAMMLFNCGKDSF